MSITRYRQERTLVRGIRRMAGQSPAAFKDNRARLRKHFEQFNIDVSELCQWLMGLRPERQQYIRDGKRCKRSGAISGQETKPFWDFFLDPPKLAEEEDPSARDGRRLAVLRVAAGWDDEIHARGWSPQPELAQSIRHVAGLPRTPTARRLFERLANLTDSHRLVLLKAAAEWIVARYLRGYENWASNREQWEKEKNEWEAAHAELTPVAREKFTAVFGQLKIQLKRPRLCLWERLREPRDNCEFAGERIHGRRHGDRCGRFDEFLRKIGAEKKFFVRNALDYLANLKKLRPSPDRLQDAVRRMTERFHEGRRASPGDEAMRQTWMKVNAELKKAGKKEIHQFEPWGFRKAWSQYLHALAIDETTILDQYGGRLPHCDKLQDNVACEFNPHTNKCEEYRKALQDLPADLLALEPHYREWRRDYLAGPRKPSFRYPSSRLLPMPKIFGKDYFKLDFKRSAVGLRLEDMAQGEFLEFGFEPWPKNYDPQPGQAEISSVHVSFVGPRARLGFRFEVAHRPSRFDGVSQDDIDCLRSQQYPRGAQDQEFLDAARARLLDAFRQNAPKELRLLAVDLGTTGAYAALFVGNRFEKGKALEINKIGALSAERPRAAKAEQRKIPGKDMSGKGRKGKERSSRGLNREHVGEHLRARDKETQEIAQKRWEMRRQPGTRPPEDPVTLGGHDLRRLTVHTRWMIRDWVRLNARRIMEIAESERADLIVFESLRGFKAASYDEMRVEPGKKRGEGFFAYGRIRRKVAEKAVERGMLVVTTPFHYSSQICSACGRWQQDENTWRKNKTGKNKEHNKRFQCESPECNLKRDPIDPDENAARVLGRVFWDEIRLPTQQEKRERQNRP